MGQEQRLCLIILYLMGSLGGIRARKFGESRMNSEDLFRITSLYTLIPRKLIKNKKNLPEIYWG